MNGIFIPFRILCGLIDNTIVHEVNDRRDKANSLRKENDCKPYQRKDCGESDFRHNGANSGLDTDFAPFVTQLRLCVTCLEDKLT